MGPFFPAWLGGCKWSGTAWHWAYLWATHHVCKAAFSMCECICWFGNWENIFNGPASLALINVRNTPFAIKTLAKLRCVAWMDTTKKRKTHVNSMMHWTYPFRCCLEDFHVFSPVFIDSQAPSTWTAGRCCLSRPKRAVRLGRCFVAVKSWAEAMWRPSRHVQEDNNGKRP